MRILPGLVSSLVAFGALAVPGAPAQAVEPLPWPGGADVVTVDTAGALGGDVSGLAYEDGSTVWAVDNGDATLARLTESAGVYSAAATWNLRYRDGAGAPDAEGVTLTAAGPDDGVYVASERNGSGDSRPSVLRYEPTGAGGELTATNEWNLSADLPGLPKNAGPEAVGWVPDSYLTAHGFAPGGTAYDPADHPGHGDGLFFVGIEQTGHIIGYALDHTDDSWERIVTISAPLDSVMDLVFDPERQQLWAACDNTCGGRTALLDVDGTGAFVVTAVHERPAGMPNLNNEGFSPAPQSECVSGRKPVLWADDGNTAGHVLRQGTIDCTPLPGSDCTSQQVAVNSAQAAVTTAQAAYDAATAALAVAQAANTQALQAAQAASTAAAAADAKVAKAKKKLAAAKKSGKAAKVVKAKKKLKAAKKAQKAAASSLASAAFAAAGTSKALGGAQATQGAAAATLASTKVGLSAAQAALAACQQS